MLINLSNHPYELWDDSQKMAAKEFGECVDLPFPAIDPAVDLDDIVMLSNIYLSKIKSLSENCNVSPVVHLMGEMVFVYVMANILRREGVRCVASTSERNTIDLGNGQKKIDFVFTRFRDYYSIE